MEYFHRRSKSAAISTQSSTASSIIKFKINRNVKEAAFRNISAAARNTMNSPRSAVSNENKVKSRRHSRLKSQRSSLQNFGTKQIDNYFNFKKPQQFYFCKKLQLAQNSSIFEQDAFKLQNLITGGYCRDDQYMSISKFNQAKDQFVLLQQVYDKAFNDPQKSRYQKQPAKKRNIFSVIYLNKNLKMMGKKQTSQLFQRWKIVR